MKHRSHNLLHAVKKLTRETSERECVTLVSGRGKGDGCWGRLNNVEVDSIILYKLWYYGINKFLTKPLFKPFQTFFMKNCFCTIFSTFP